MLLKKNIEVGKIRLKLFFLAFCLIVLYESSKADNLNVKFTDIKVLDKVSSKNKLLKLKNGEDFNYKDLLIKSIKCKNSEFDDNQEITAYIQVRDLRNKDKNDVFVFNGWMFSSSPSIAPFDHPVYDIWLVGCN